MGHTMEKFLFCTEFKITKHSPISPMDMKTQMSNPIHVIAEHFFENRISLHK